MEILRVEIPDYRLAPFVCCFAHRETLPGSQPITQPLTASLGPVFSFDLGDRVVCNRPGVKPYLLAHAHLLGTQTRYFGQAYLSGHVLEFGIFFRTFALWQLFGIPPAELVDHDGDATEVMSSWIAEFWCKLVEAGSFAERITVATRTLLPLVNTARPLTSIMSTVHRLLPTSSGDAARIVQVARESAMSIRSYERQFAAEIGFSPKTFFRLARFDKAVDSKRRTRDSWLNISHDLGYFDQMHMIRDFRLFGGDTPGRLFVPNADFQPWSIRNPPESR
jgi:AraC-like DNA-binding protein